MRTVFSTRCGGLLITLQQNEQNKLFRVTYFKQVKSDLNYAAAAKELGACIMHAMACEGILDNEDVAS